MKQSDVMPTLRKNPASSLWNYEVSKWSPIQIKEFLFLRDGYKETRPTQKKKVIRIADGMIYESIIECAKANGISYMTVKRNPGKYEIGQANFS